MKGTKVLEAGAGTGRYTQHLLQTGAYLTICEPTDAIEINRELADESTWYNAIQTDIEHVPFDNENFDTVICLGHIPNLQNPDSGIINLYQLVKPGGKLFFDCAAISWMHLIKTTLLFRWLLKVMSAPIKEKCIYIVVNLLFPIHWSLRNINVLQFFLNRLSPCFFYYREFPDIPKHIHFDITMLDTLDFCVQPYFHFTTRNHLLSLLQQTGAENITIRKGGIGWEVSCCKPLTKTS